MTSDFVEEASTQYTDWRGTVAADDPDFEWLHDRVGLDRDRYFIVGFRVHHEVGSEVTVYAVDRGGLGDFHLSDFIGTDGVLRVIAFTDTSGLRWDEVLGLFKRLEIMAKLRGMVADRGVDLQVVEHRESPPLLAEE